MIFHLYASGVPVTWCIAALYRDDYGIAHAAAAAWYGTREPKPGRRDDEPQCIVELAGDDERGWRVMRSDLWMDDDRRRSQSPDDGKHLVQLHTAAVPLSEKLGAAITEALRAKLIEFGYLIPRGEWQRRYPAQAMMGRRFAEFFEAERAARANRKELPFDLKWAPYMDIPEGTHFPYSTGHLMPDGSLEEHDKGGTPVVVTRPDDKALWTLYEHPSLPAFATRDDAQAAMRLLNSGWTPEEVAVLLTEEPVRD